MDKNQRGVVLVGHGGVPSDCPNDLIMKLKRLEAQRRASGSPMSPEESEVDQKVRHWPRTPETDPYKSGLETLGSHLRSLLNGEHFALAYNEFCTPTLEEAVEALIAEGAKDITVISTMFTPGGSHSEIEVPESLEALRKTYPDIVLRYAWPFDLNLVSGMLAEQVKRFA